MDGSFSSELEQASTGSQDLILCVPSQCHTHQWVHAGSLELGHGGSTYAWEMGKWNKPNQSLVPPFSLRAGC